MALPPAIRKARIIERRLAQGIRVSSADSSFLSRFKGQTSQATRVSLAKFKRKAEKDIRIAREGGRRISGGSAGRQVGLVPALGGLGGTVTRPNERSRVISASFKKGDLTTAQIKEVIKSTKRIERARAGIEPRTLQPQRFFLNPKTGKFSTNKVVGQPAVTKRTAQFMQRMIREQEIIRRKERIKSRQLKKIKQVENKIVEKVREQARKDKRTLAERLAPKVKSAEKRLFKFNEKLFRVLGIKSSTDQRYERILNENRPILDKGKIIAFETLKTAARFPIRIAQIPLVIGGRVALASAALLDKNDRQVLKQAVTEVPGAVKKSYNVKSPEGVFNIIATASGIRAVKANISSGARVTSSAGKITKSSKGGYNVKRVGKVVVAGKKVTFIQRATNVGLAKANKLIRNTKVKFKQPREVRKQVTNLRQRIAVKESLRRIKPQLKKAKGLQKRRILSEQKLLTKQLAKLTGKKVRTIPKKITLKKLKERISIKGRGARKEVSLLKKKIFIKNQKKSFETQLKTALRSEKPTIIARIKVLNRALNKIDKKLIKFKPKSKITKTIKRKFKATALQKAKGLRKIQLQKQKQINRLNLRIKFLRNAIRRTPKATQKPLIRERNVLVVKLNKLIGKKPRKVKRISPTITGTKKEFKFLDPLTGIERSFPSFKQYIRVVKKTIKEQKQRGQVPKDLQQSAEFFVKSYRIRKAIVQKARNKKDFRNIVNRKVSKSISKEQSAVKLIIKDLDKAKQTQTGSRQQLVLLKKVKSKAKTTKTIIDNKLKNVKSKLNKETKQQTVLVSKTKNLSKTSSGIKKLTTILLSEAALASYSIVLSVIAQTPASKLVIIPISKQKQQQAQSVTQIQKKDVAKTPAQALKEIVGNVALPITATGLGLFFTGTGISKLITNRLVPLGGAPFLGRLPFGFGSGGKGRGRGRIGKRFYDPNQFAVLFGIRASPAERKRLLRAGRIFTGFETRKIV